jgi:Tol biopolymer transport system component
MIFFSASHGKRGGTFSEPRSTLLFRDASIYLTTGQLKTKVPYPTCSIVEGAFPLPALAPTGDKIAVEIVQKEGSPESNCDAASMTVQITQDEKYRSTLAVYSLHDKSWKLYGDFCPDELGSITFSPKGTEVAFISKKDTFSRPVSGTEFCFENPAMLQVLDLETGKFTIVPYTGESLMEGTRLSWSPDGKYLMGELGSNTSPTHHIIVIDVNSGDGKIIANGTNPSWSPKGDSIAFIVEGQKGDKCMLVHYGEAGLKIVRDLEKESSGYSVLYNGGVWSPEGDRLLFNEMNRDEPVRRVTVLDLTTGKITIRSTNGLAVFGWAGKTSD